MNRTITVQHNGSTYYAKVARIESTMIGTQDHGILTAFLHCEGDGWGVGVGGFALDQYDKAAEKRITTAYGLDHIVQIMTTVGVDTWEKIPGREVLVLFDSEHSWGSKAVGLAHISDESKVLILKEHVAEWKAREGTQEED